MSFGKASPWKVPKQLKIENLLSVQEFTTVSDNVSFLLSNKYNLLKQLSSSGLEDISPL